MAQPLAFNHDGLGMRWEPIRSFAGGWPAICWWLAALVLVLVLLLLLRLVVVVVVGSWVVVVVVVLLLLLVFPPGVRWPCGYSLRATHVACLLRLPHFCSVPAAPAALL